ncbi:PREDICTED: uncharacterized protein LOC106330501 [Brassica oleracea var. oleracea]|uniref:uncharacterized protein LOC106330501 n=1 Tax=Brassica oleracea var. oleracea TaxID=109376 RepID=UPI0006A6AEAC|nr:PREDICTED: uncharacterized protein LOC106330501 [Brassica oleracea var. oleracea]
MNTAFWNCRGLKGSLTVRRLKGIKATFSPDVLFLIETKNSDDTIRDVCSQLGYDCVRCVSPRGIGGGLALLWNKDIDIVINAMDERMFDCVINNKNGIMYFTCVYGHPIRALRHHFWEKLQRIATTRKGPWLLCGDFNEILKPEEKIGGPPREPWSMMDFNLMTKVCRLQDLPFSGNNMTWAGNRKGHKVQSWLDRGFGNDEFRALYPASRVIYLEMIESDHRPAIIQIRKTTDFGKKSFCFDNRLTEREGFKEVIIDGWKSTLPGQYVSVSDRIRKCRHAISQWKKANNTNSAKHIKALTALIDEAHSDPLCPLRNIQESLGNINHVVSDECNAYLSRDVTAEEVRISVFSIGATRAPGPDGLTASFYQTYWDIVGPAVVEEVQHFFNTGEFYTDLNHTNLCLIPKIPNPITMKDFRPIALFRKRISENYMAVKTDVSKAYDRIEWKFLAEVMRKKGFCEKWIMLIMKCVTSVSFSVMVNGSSYGHMNGTRGLRQGDPLSPTLFILCADVLSSLIQQAERNNEIQPVRLSIGGPSISHLLFADDSLFFLKADQTNSLRLLQIFKDYENVSGQMINLEKSSITFGTKVFQQTRDMIQNTLGIPNIGDGGKYLGLPEQFGRNKKEMFMYVRDSVNGKVNGWQNRYLNMAGKEILIKSVALAMSVYSINCFKLPVELCNEIDGILSRFWWGSTETNRKMSWLSWKRLSKSKQSGGLGFRNLQSFNQALLANQVWKINQRPNSLVYRVLKHRYFKKTTMSKAKRGYQSSYGWQSLLHGRDLLEQGMQYSIGSGDTTTISDTWLPITPPRAPRLLPYSNPLLSVKTLIDPISNQWDLEVIHDLIEQSDIPIIQKVYLPYHPVPDGIIWPYTSDGNYSVKSGYHYITITQDAEIIPPPLASSPALTKMIWIVAVKENLRHRHIPVDPICPRCCDDNESSDHAFFTCLFSQQVWRLSGWVKCNYDSAHREGSQDSGMGWLVRNNQGTLLEAGMGIRTINSYGVGIVCADLANASMLIVRL